MPLYDLLVNLVLQCTNLILTFMAVLLKETNSIQESLLCPLDCQGAYLTTCNIQVLPGGLLQDKRLIFPSILSTEQTHTAIIKVFSAEKHYMPLLIQGDTACVIVHTLLSPPCSTNRSGDLLILLLPCGIGCSPAGSSKCLLAPVSVGYLWWPVSTLILRLPAKAVSSPSLISAINQKLQSHVRGS